MIGAKLPEKSSFSAIKGEMAERVRAFDWASTPLGPIAQWPQSLKTAVGMVLLSPVPIVMLWGEDGIMIYNDGYSEFAGQRHPSLLGSKVREGWPEVADFNDNIMKVGLAGGTLAYRDFVLNLNRTGTFEPVWLDLDYSPILDESGQPAGVMAIVIEITKRVLAEKKVRAETERFAEMFRQAPSFIAQLDGPEHLYTFTNNAYQTLIGHRDIIGKTIREALPELEGQGFYELLDQVYRSGEPFVGRASPVELKRIPDAPAESVLLDFVYQPVKAADGSVTGIFVEGFDVTEQRVAEDALRQSEERLRLATENSGVGLWDINTAHEISFTYSRSSSPFIMDSENRVPMEHLLSHLHPDDAAKLQAAYAAARDPAQRAMMDVEYRVVPTENQPLRWVKVRGRGVFDVSGTCTHVSGTAIDITALKQAQTRDTVMAELAERFRTLEEPDDLAFAASEILGHALSVNRVGYGTIDPVRETITIRRDWNAPGIQSLAGTLHFRDYGTYIDELKRGVTVVISDAREDPRTAETAAALEGINARAFVNMPVTEQAGFVALLYLTSDTPRVWAEEELELVRQVAEHTRVAVERRRAENALAQSEARLRLATENAEIGMWDMDVLNNVNYSSPRVKAMFGIAPPDDPPSEEFFKLVHPDDIARVEQAYAAAFDPALRGSYDVAYRVIGRDGVLRWVHAKGRGVFDSLGRCVRVSGTAVDITAEHETEEALRRSEEQLRLATEYADVGLWDIDIVNDIVYWPPRVNAMFGFAPDHRVTMKDFRGRIHPDDKRRTIELILAACDPAQRSFYDAEYRIVRENDGEVRWLSAKGRAVFDDAGVCVRMLGIIIDITARKEIEERAKASEARFRALFESIDDGFCIIEAIRGADGSVHDFRYIEENPALAKRSGVIGVKGHTIREMLPTEAEGWIAILAKVLDSGEPMRFERFLETTSRLLELYVLRVETQDSNQVAVLFQDITDRRAAEMQLHEMNETLERRVAERTAALERSQAALQQAQKMEAIGNLTGGIAHDFNNLLQGVTGSLDLIRRKPEDVEKVRRWAEAGLQASERGAKLTAQLLAFSRSQKLELKPLDLTELLLGMRDLLTRTLGPSVNVTINPDAASANVMGDETQLELAVLNLAINARDAMPNGGELVIATHRHDVKRDADLEPGDYIELTVTDSGTGMPADIAARAFDPFFTTKGVGKGTGLGLSQVYGMARQAGGIARIVSKHGEGTVVRIFLRATSANVQRDAAQAETRAQDQKTATILIVDDDGDVRRFLADSLDAFGYCVVQAENGMEGLAALSRATPDMMIVDFAMPGMTGAEVAQKARAAHPALPIIFASGYAETSALENVADDKTLILRKPFRISELQDAVTRALGR